MDAGKDVPGGAVPWERIEPLFHEALELPPEQRETFLAQRCGDDVALRAELRSLLAAAEGPSPLDAGPRLARTGPGREDPAAARPAPGDRVGPWLLVREIGEGGMGEVFLAERADGQFSQRVAIKFLKPAAADQLARFDNERRILASLSHPGIARLIDGGVSADGRPYMVMEHVDGVPINQYVRQVGLDVEGILALFDQVCEAVAEAHAHLVVHRDLKPSNVLVTADGRVKLLDFGVAKLLPGAGLRAEHTRATPLTPSHAAPEQLSGRAVTTATDVYALGVMLHELLTGVSPWSEIEHLPMSVAIRRRLEREPPPASEAARRAGSPARARRLRGDLDAILARALRVRPADRYPTVEALRADLRRHREGFAVEARLGDRAYRLRRAIWRYRWPLVATVAIVALLSAFVLRLNAEAERARRAEAQALLQARTAAETVDYLVSLFEAASPAHTGGRPIAPRSLVDAGVRRLDGRLDASPELRAQLLATLSRLYSELGFDADALATAEAAEAAVRELPGAVRARTRIARGRALDRSGRYAEAAETLRAALEDLPAGDPAIAELRLSAELLLGSALVNNAQVDEGLAVLRRAREQAQRMAPGGQLHADLLSAEAVALAMAGESERALALQQQAADMLARLLPEDHPRRIDAIATLGHIAYFAQRLELAREAFEQALAAAAGQYDPDSEVIRNMQRGLVNTLSDLGRVREAIALEEAIVASQRRSAGATPALAISLLNLATDYNRLGDYAPALEAAQEAAKLFDPEQDPVGALRAELVQAEALLRMGHSEQMLALLDDDRIAADRSGVLGAGFRALRHMYRCDALLDLSRLAEAEEELARAEALVAQWQSPSRRIVHGLTFRRGRLAADRGELAEGLRLMREALEGIRALGLHSPIYTLEIEAEVASVLLAMGQRDAAREILDRIEPQARALLAPTASVLLTIDGLRRRLRTAAA